MRPTVEQLRDNDRYELIESFAIDEMSQFVRRELGISSTKEQLARNAAGGRSVIVGLVGIMLGVTGFLLGGLLIKAVGTGEGGNYLLQMGVGVVAFFLIVPIHELIHGLGFRAIGAESVKYGWSLKNLMVYAYAQEFPTTMYEVALVAAMPFVIITTGIVLSIFVWPVYTAFLLTLLLIHTGGCVGDFALIKYYIKNRQRLIYTYDDVDHERRSYFFAERSGLG